MTVALARAHAKAGETLDLSVDVGDRKIVRAGTIYPSNDENAFGIVASDYDVTDGDVNMAVIVSGVVMRAALPVTPSYAAEQAMKNILFVGGSAPVTPAPTAAYIVDVASGTGYSTAIEEGSSRVVYEGGSFAFKITIATGYHKGSGFVVKANGTALTADDDGIYTIEDIDADQAITVEGVEAD